ncbi:uncharacterized protein BDZ99DRAFT_194019 [Mytilinidion resinicola]|uniref:Prion-inhibition and propagation HeLo domain-containing protein n=1 Tax=Mytilinidion resinicola TaxID=574789 RepID=A0A6A6Z567_9PEZI|nr:uncharacterized protein BDZ99DRAFT_194019 [Mytilinidion resinicola]KAF2815325.1 hypothetical protein BDZ99DRAFT_194019 [Mytilinidion resinicola]
MEPAGLAVGIAGLAGLFSASVDCFEYVQFAKNFDQDLVTSQLKLDAAGFRLSRWGEAIRIHDHATASLPEDRYKRAEKILTDLCNLFVQGQEKSEIFGDSSTATYDPGADMSPAQLFVHSGIITKTRKRVERQRPNFLKRTKWALYKKKELASLIDDIAALVSQLELILLPGQEPAQTLQRVAELDAAEITEVAETQASAGAITTLDVAETLGDAAEGLDPYLEEAVKKLVEGLRPEKEGKGTTYSIRQTGNTGNVAAHNAGTQTYYGGGVKGGGA